MCQTPLQTAEVNAFDSQIDDEADVYGIDFVKISDSMVAKDHGVYSTPALVYFRKKMPVA